MNNSVKTEINPLAEIDRLEQELENANKCISVLREDYAKLKNEYMKLQDKFDKMCMNYKTAEAQRDALIYSARVVLTDISKQA